MHVDTNQQLLKTRLIYFQLVVYSSMARACTSTWTIQNIPTTAYSGKVRPSDSRIKATLLEQIIDRYKILKSVLTEDTPRLSSCLPNETQDLLQKMIAKALPLAFEATLLLTLDPSNKESNIGITPLLKLIEDAEVNDLGWETISICSDLVLSAAYPDNLTSHNSQMQCLSKDDVITILSKIIDYNRHSPEYNITKAARWIRCMFRITLDGLQDTKDKALQDDDQEQIQMAQQIVDQALNLARSTSISSSAQAASDSNFLASHKPNSTYPIEELEWLAAVLFNLAIDYYLAERIEIAEIWAAKAIDTAQVLATPQGDNGMMLALLKGRCEKMGWKHLC